jgi:UDP-glucose 4-epimerase
MSLEAVLRIVVLGGAGYIGSHFSHLALKRGWDVIVFDDLSTGHSWAVQGGKIVVANILDTVMLTDTLRGADAVCHFAAKSLVEESVANPSLYFRNNVCGTESVLRAMDLANVRNLVFSSTAAVYGIPANNVPVLTESHLASPVNPYGQSKLQAEVLIDQWARRGNKRAISLRYFNAAGAMPEAGLGEAHEPETHLIPNILRILLSYPRKEFKLFGDDYPTDDGTCVRDYIHVTDIGIAHIMGLEFLIQTNNPFTVCNLGSGVGYSNLEVIKACESIAGRSLNVKTYPRRIGDPPMLVSSNSKALDLLGWEPSNSDLYEVIGSAYRWHHANR